MVWRPGHNVGPSPPGDAGQGPRLNNPAADGLRLVGESHERRATLTAATQPTLKRRAPKVVIAASAPHVLLVVQLRLPEAIPAYSDGQDERNACEIQRQLHIRREPLPQMQELPGNRQPVGQAEHNSVDEDGHKEETDRGQGGRWGAA